MYETKGYQLMFCEPSIMDNLDLTKRTCHTSQRLLHVLIREKQPDAPSLCTTRNHVCNIFLKNDNLPGAYTAASPFA